MSYIALNYYKRIKLGMITNINRVGKIWRSKVIEYLEADNYIVEEDGNIVNMNP